MDPFLRVISSRRRKHKQRAQLSPFHTIVSSRSSTTADYKCPLWQIEIEVNHLRYRYLIGAVPYLKSSGVGEDKNVPVAV